MESNRICIILDLRMPLFLADFTLLEIGKEKNYFDVDRTEVAFRERYEKTIRPLIDTIENLEGERKFKFSLFLSGNFLALLEKNYPDEVKRLGSFLKNGTMDLIGGCYSNSLASLFSKKIFELDIKRHQAIITKVFGHKANTFMNPENIYSNEIAIELKKAGFQACFIDHIPWYMNGNHPRQIFKALIKDNFQLMVMEYAAGKLLEKDKKDKWTFVKLVPYAETQGKDWGTRIHDLIADSECFTVSEAIKKSRPANSISAPSPIGAVARPQGLAGLIQNPMQKKSLETLFSLEEQILKKGDKNLIDQWIGLSNVEYLLSMNPDKVEGTRPYDIFIRYMNILTDINIRIS